MYRVSRREAKRPEFSLRFFKFDRRLALILEYRRFAMKPMNRQQSRYLAGFLPLRSARALTIS